MWLRVLSISPLASRLRIIKFCFNITGPYGIISAVSTIQKYFFFFSPSILILSWFCNSLLSIISHPPLFIRGKAQFSVLNPIPISWLYILIVCIRASSSFSFLANILVSSVYIRWHHSYFFHTSVYWRSLTGVTANILRPPGFVSVFWPISTMVLIILSISICSKLLS